LTVLFGYYLDIIIWILFGYCFDYYSDFFIKPAKKKKEMKVRMKIMKEKNERNEKDILNHIIHYLFFNNQSFFF
jgi:hypothetical protein